MWAAICALDSPLKLRFTCALVSSLLNRTVPTPEAVDVFGAVSRAPISWATNSRVAGAVVSLSRMVSIAVFWLPRVPPTGLFKLRLRVSLPST